MLHYSILDRTSAKKTESKCLELQEPRAKRMHGWCTEFGQAIALKACPFLCTRHCYASLRSDWISCEFYCVLLYILYCFFSFTYTVYLCVCMSPVYVYGPCCLILNKMTNDWTCAFICSRRSKFEYRWRWTNTGERISWQS